ncbi:MAG TPA: O-antigen translocase [Candidatus Paceibacterota bacterium]|nr:O-antigen translocase [Candidatus Paceibacterota bacterium]
MIEHPPQVDPTAHEGKKSYGQILKSSALIGGSSVVGIGIGIIRTKAMALFLGPAGVGLMGLYSSILDLTNSLAGMGINSSGVRQIAEAVGSGETGRIARTVAVLRRTAIVLGVLGALLLIVSSREVSRLTFGSDQHTAAVAVLALAVFFGAIAGGQGALIQGMRRISDLAKMGVLGNLFGVMISVPLVYFFREDGIVPSLVAIAAMGILTSWWYSRKVQIQAQRVTLHEVKQEASALLKLGFVFMASGVLTMGAAYAIRLIVLRKVGFEAAGLYQSAWALGGMYVAFITQSMVADFYPRLTAVARDNAECNRLVNEQAEISQLLAGPGVIATMTFAPLVIAMFYSSRFAAAVEPLRWICFGMALRVIAWPMGFIILAKGLQTIFFWVEVGATVIHVGLAFMFVGYYGLPGATIAFFGLYVCYGIFVYVIVRRLSGFRWCAANRRIGLLFVPVITVVFCSFYWLPFWVATTVGSVATLASAVYSIRLLVRLMPMNRIPRPIRQLLVWLRIAPSGII